MRKRIEQVIWVLEHRRDLEADFRSFYHLSPKQSLALPGPEFLALAYRSTVFPGVMASRAAKMQEEARKRAKTSAPKNFDPNRPPRGDRNESLIDYATST